jgi:hypothetical protein
MIYNDRIGGWNDQSAQTFDLEDGIAYNGGEIVEITVAVAGYNFCIDDVTFSDGTYYDNFKNREGFAQIREFLKKYHYPEIERLALYVKE